MKSPRICVLNLGGVPRLGLNLGMIKALLEILSYHFIIGCSAGGIIAKIGALPFQDNIVMAEKIIANLSTDKLVSKSSLKYWMLAGLAFSVLAPLIKTEGYLRRIFRSGLILGTTCLAGYEVYNTKSMYSFDPIMEILDKIVFRPAVKSCVIAFDKDNEKNILFVDKDPLPNENLISSKFDNLKALKSTTALPGLFEPVYWEQIIREDLSIGNSWCVDGGLGIPIHLAMQTAVRNGCDIMIIGYHGKCDTRLQDSRAAIQEVHQCFALHSEIALQHAMRDIQSSTQNPLDIVVVGGGSIQGITLEKCTPDKMKALIKKGYQNTKLAMPAIYAAIERWQRRQEIGVNNE